MAKQIRKETNSCFLAWLACRLYPGYYGRNTMSWFLVIRVVLYDFCTHIGTWVNPGHKKMGAGEQEPKPLQLISVVIMESIIFLLPAKKYSSAIP